MCMCYICEYIHTLTHYVHTHPEVYTLVYTFYAHTYTEVYIHTLYIITQKYTYTHRTNIHRNIYRHTYTQYTRTYSHALNIHKCIHAVLFYNLFNFLVLSKAQSALFLILKNQDFVPKTAVTQKCTAGAGHPARPTGLKAPGGPVPDDGDHLRRCPGLSSGESEQGSHKTMLHKAPSLSHPPAPKTRSLLTALLPCLLAPGTVS